MSDRDKTSVYLAFGYNFMQILPLNVLEYGEKWRIIAGLKQSLVGYHTVTIIFMMLLYILEI